MAILALIVTPLVMNIIRKARVSADKRSIDAYGRSIEIATASYLLDTGTFPTEISELAIEYSGDTVTCETTQINPDSSVYLNGCKVKNRNVEGYSYDNSDDFTGCENDYDSSEIKYVVDAWAMDKVPSGLQESRLIKEDEIETETHEVDMCGGYGCMATVDIAKYDWLKGFDYWTMTPNISSISTVLVASSGGSTIQSISVVQSGLTVRPVIVLSKSVLSNQ